MVFKLFLISILILIPSCSEKSSHKNQTVTEDKTFKKYFCYINRIFDYDSAKFIEIDLINLIMGDSAVTVAKNYGKAKYEISENGDIVWFVPNDYYIVNVKNDSVKFELDHDC